jgi:ABC-type cobalamin/Fe3+-siderophores transport system ATPase subunit
VLIVGLNGTGKSTLLRCLSGIHFHQPEQVQCLGQPVFQQTPRSLTFLGAEWRHNPLVKTDVEVLAYRASFRIKIISKLCRSSDCSKVQKDHQIKFVWPSSSKCFPLLNTVACTSYQMDNANLSKLQWWVEFIR